MINLADKLDVRDINGYSNVFNRSNGRLYCLMLR